ncbi:MAG: TonB-dependent receptor [Pseudomonadota bacterium]
MRNSGERVRSWLLAVLFGIFAVSGSAYAQQTEDEDDETQADDYVPPAKEEITVTGSRIKRDEFSSTSPISVITRETSALAGLLSASDILQGSTSASGQQVDDSFSGFVTDGGPGANTLSLRGLGAQRTLILVNGKRWGPSGVRGSTNSVDLTSIPTASIARFEILKDGASSVYGADAVAGVVNAITRQRLDGGQINVQARVPGNSGGEGIGIDGAWGKVGDNWSFSVSGQYAFQTQLVEADRGFSECDRRPRLTDQDGDGTIDNRDPVTGEELCFGFIYGLVSGPFGFTRYEPSLVPGSDATNPFFDPQVNGTFGIPFFTTAPENGLDNSGAFYRDVRSPSESQMISESYTTSLNSFGEYDFEVLSRDATVYYETYLNRRSTDANGGFGQFFPTVPATNPSNPFGVNGPLAGLGGFSAIPVLPTYNLRNPVTNVGVTRSNTFVGVRGDLSETWTYDAYAGYSHSRGTYKNNFWLADRVTQALDATLDGNGNLVCNDPSNGCVAPNLFSEAALLRGEVPQAFIDFISKDTLGETRYIGHQASAFVTGDLFEGWAGPVSAVFGLEWRQEEIADVPDIESQDDNIFNFTSAQITAGSDIVREAFVELEIPLLTDMRFAEDLSLNLATRYTDYNSYGDDTTSRIALNYQITPAVRIRGTWGESFRAPDLFEQFLGNEVGFLSAFGIDPCIQYGDTFNPGDVIYDNCAAQGLPEDFGSDGLPGIRTITGGNEALEAETSDSWTAGIIIQPESLGVSLAVNWFSIEVENTVASPSIAFVVNDCFTSRGFTSSFCGRIAPRDATGALTDVDASLLNIGLQTTKGIDFDILWQKEFESADLSVDLTVTRIEESVTELLGTTFDLAGRWGLPQWTADADIRVDYRDWTFNWRVDWIGNSAQVPNFDPGTTNIDRVFQTGHNTTNSVSARYSANDWELIATITNVLDSDPPIVPDGYPGNQTGANRIFNTLPGVGYDVLGRTFVLQYSRGF